MDKPNFVYVTYIATTSEKLWEALTSAEFTQQYWGRDWPRIGSIRSIESDWKAGSPVRMVLGDGEVEWWGEVLQADPPRTLSYTFCVEMGTETRSRVRFEIEPSGPVVKLTLTHDRFEPEATAEALAGAISSGWPAILSSMKTLLERGRALELGAPAAG